jgi:hypothetical protein
MGTTIEAPATQYYYHLKPGDDFPAFPPAAAYLLMEKATDLGMAIDRVAAVLRGYCELDDGDADPDTVRVMRDVLETEVAALQVVQARGVSWREPATGEEA